MSKNLTITTGLFVAMVFAASVRAAPFNVNVTESDKIDTTNCCGRGIFGGSVAVSDTGTLGGDRANDLGTVLGISGFDWTSSTGTLSLMIDLDTTDSNSTKFSFDLDVVANGGSPGYLNGNSFGRLGVDDGPTTIGSYGCCGDHNIDLGEDITFTVSNVNTINAPVGQVVVFNKFDSITYRSSAGAIATGLDTDTLNIASSQNGGPMVNGFNLEFDYAEAPLIPAPAALSAGLTLIALAGLRRRRA